MNIFPVGASTIDVPCIVAAEIAHHVIAHINDLVGNLPVGLCSAVGLCLGLCLIVFVVLGEWAAILPWQRVARACVGLHAEHLIALLVNKNHSEKVVGVYLLGKSNFLNIGTIC